MSREFLNSSYMLPKLTSGERDALDSPPTGLVIYNTTTNALNLYNGTAWKVVTVS